MITRGSILWILEIVWPLYILASHLLCYVLQYCSLCNTWTINLSINLFVCLRGGELHRSVCRNQKCRTVITLGGVLVHYHQDLASRPMSVSSLSSLSSACSQLPHKCTVLSGCPDADAHQAPSAGCAGSVPRIRTHQYLQPGTWRGNSAHNPYCSVN